jgi:hypothetical protein
MAAEMLVRVQHEMCLISTVHSNSHDVKICLEQDWIPMKQTLQQHEPLLQVPR